MSKTKKNVMIAGPNGAWILWFAAGVVALVLAACTLLRHYRLASMEDLAMFDQMLWNVRGGHGLWTTISGNVELLFGHHFFGEHLSPILYLLAWPAGLTSGPEMLLVIQALALAFAAIPAARLTSYATGSPRMGLVAGLLWLALPGLWQGAFYDFHMEVFEAGCLFAFWLSLRRGAVAPAWIWGALYAACKEDAAAYLILVALAGGLQFRRWRLALPIAAVALTYTVLAVTVLMPLFSPTGQPLLQSRALTPGTCGGFWPWVTMVALDAERWNALGQHLLVFAGLPLLGGVTLIPAAAAVGLMWLSNNSAQSNITLHYTFTVYPLFFLAAAEGLGRFHRWMTRAPRWGRLTGFWALTALAVFGLSADWHRDVACTRQFLGVGDTSDFRAARAILARIPPLAAITAPFSIVPHLARRNDLRLLLNPSTNTEWIVTRLDEHVYPFELLAHQVWLRDELLSPNSAYGVYATDSRHLVVLRNGAPNTGNAAVLAHIQHTLDDLNMCHRIGRNVFDPSAKHQWAWHATPRDPNDTMVYGPYTNLPPGHYRVVFRIRGQPASLKQSKPYIRLDVTEDRGEKVCGERAISEPMPAYREIPLDVTLTKLGNAEFRVHKTGRAHIWVDSIEWQRLPLD